MLINHLKDNFDKAKKLHQKGDLISAISIYLEILKIDKNNSIINFYLGTAYLQSGAFENSIKYLEKSLSSKSTNPMIYNNLGISFMEIFEFEKAKENFDKALKIKIDFPEVYNNQGIIFRKLKDFDQSLKYLKKAIELKPYYSEAYNNTGNTLNDIGEKEMKRISKSNLILVLGDRYEVYAAALAAYFLKIPIGIPDLKILPDPEV